MAEAVFAGRAHPPSAFLARVQRAVRDAAGAGERGPAAMAAHARAGQRASRSSRRVGWAVGAAAAAALALGIGVAPRSSAELVVPPYASGTDEVGVWLSDDATVAGAPMLEGLSDEALFELLGDLMAEAGGRP
jgi:hypothetical protein